MHVKKWKLHENLRRRFAAAKPMRTERETEKSLTRGLFPQTSGVFDNFAVSSSGDSRLATKYETNNIAEPRMPP